VITEYLTTLQLCVATLLCAI